MRQSIFLVTLLVVLSVLLNTVFADNAFAGCQNSLPSGIYNATAASTTAIKTGSACQQACYAATNPNPAVAGRTNYRHSMFRLGDYTCLCTDKYASVGNQDNGMQDSCTNPADWDNRIVETTFIKYPNCYAAAPAGITFTQIAGPDSCSIKCESSLNMIFFMDATDGYYSCGCGTIGTFPATAAICGPNTYFAYYHTVTQASAGLSRRKLREQIVAKHRQGRLCPTGLTACRVSDASEAFECLDTKADIDSCGGCVFGTINEPAAPVGKDCYSRGTSMGGATCQNGQCQVTRCMTGYSLESGSCVRSQMVLS